MRPNDSSVLSAGLVCLQFFFLLSCVSATRCRILFSCRQTRCRGVSQLRAAKQLVDSASKKCFSVCVQVHCCVCIFRDCAQSLAFFLFVYVYIFVCRREERFKRFWSRVMTARTALCRTVPSFSGRSTRWSVCRSPSVSWRLGRLFHDLLGWRQQV